VLIESVNFQLKISEPEWRLTPKEEAERAKQAAASLENFMREGNGNTDEAQGGQAGPADPQHPA
jgi:hypothetical protein